MKTTCSERSRRIILIGCQGSGKSTQAELLSKKFSLPLLSTGDLCRQTSQEDSVLGKRVRNLVKRGILVDDSTILEMVKKFLTKEGRKGFIAEGFPRNLSQAKALKEKIDFVFYIKVSQKEALRRLTARWLCSQCKENFNILTKPPKRKGFCDRCGGKLTQRKDDQKAAVKQRLALYFKETEPVLKYYQNQGLVHEINGEQPIPTIHQDIMKIIESSRDSH